ncbi:hypothetical protein P7K49_021283 [Saguinus oedipus]|uniref:Uncharacterized protein n=1 Tax=Saguinus oedipus TaxID=9490 RepID=A0ABQ9US86_SAGOE|nr:hypothetical protein P7K49_021283 [Saguinus oedipus]
MIRQGGNHLVLKVVTVTRNLDPDDTARKKAPPPPKRAPTTALTLRSKSMTSELEELGKSHTQPSPAQPRTVTMPVPELPFAKHQAVHEPMLAHYPLLAPTPRRVIRKCPCMRSSPTRAPWSLMGMDKDLQGTERGSGPLTPSCRQGKGDYKPCWLLRTLLRGVTMKPRDTFGKRVAPRRRDGVWVETLSPLEHKLELVKAAYVGTEINPCPRPTVQSSWPGALKAQPPTSAFTHRSQPPCTPDTGSFPERGLANVATAVKQWSSPLGPGH